MSNKKHKYVIRAGTVSKAKGLIRYVYGQTAVELNVSPRGFHISYERPYTDKLLNEGIVRDAIRKGELLCLLRYSESLKYKKVDAIIDGQSRCLYNVDDGGIPLIYKMFSDTLTTNMSEAWKSKKIQECIANTVKSKYDRRYAALFALIMAKSKEYEMEKFIYLWMSMNALYGFISSKLNRGIRKESKQLQVIAMYYGFKYNGGPDYMKDLTRGQLMGFLEAVKDEERAVVLTAIEQNEWNVKSLQEAKNIVEQNIGMGQLDPMGTFLLWLPYQLRCKYFHGEKAVPVMSFSDERPIPVLSFLNTLLESFLDKELVKWFDMGLVENEMTARLNNINFN